MLGSLRLVALLISQSFAASTSPFKQGKVRQKIQTYLLKKQFLLENTRIEEWDYLKKFYHLEGRHSLRSKRDNGDVELKIRDMQGFFGLEPSGRLDQPTLDTMRRPRCGVPDVQQYSFYPSRSRWRNNTITYRIKKYTRSLTRQEVESSVQKALKIWSDAAPLRFVQVDHGEADIMITFESKGHGDFFPFDGPRGVLAHAFEPGEDIGGDVHFDNDEVWTTGGRKLGYNLFAVAAHELGHSLGLSHSRDPTALMYPNYRYIGASQYELPRDDALGIQALYGTYKTRTPKEVPQKCNPHMSFDAVAVVGQEIAFFKNRYIWLRAMWLGFRSILREGYISTYLSSISSSVDAAYDIPAKGVTYLFTGPKYWIMQKFNTKSYYGSIYEFGFPSRVTQIDAAVHLNEYGKTYFFIGDMYYRYDELKNAMDPSYPMKTETDWPGIGGKIDAAFELAGYIHFFTGPTAHAFDYRQRRVQYSVRANKWVGC